MSTERKLTILHADTNTLFCESLAIALREGYKPEWKYVHCTEWSEVKRVLTTEKVDLLLLDLYLGTTDVFNEIEQLKKSNAALRILVVTHYKEPDYARKIFQSGVDGYLLKTRAITELIDGISQVMKGEVFIDHDVSLTGQIIKEGPHLEDGLAITQALTPREMEILTLISESKTNKDIGEELFISDQTVGVHRKNLMRKMGVRNTTALIKKALRYNLITIL